MMWGRVVRGSGRAVGWLYSVWGGVMGIYGDHRSGPWKKVGSSWRREETPEWDGHSHGDVPASPAGIHTREPAAASP